MSNRQHTFLRRTAYYVWRVAPFSGDFGRRFTGIVHGLVPDSIAEAVRQAVSMVLPRKGGTPVDALPHLLKTFGLLGYPGEGYPSTIDRLLDAWNTHARGGTPGGVELELARAGFTGTMVEYPDTLVLDPTAYTSDFWITFTVPPVANTGVVYGSGPPVYGEFVYGISGITSQEIVTTKRIVQYWQDAGTRYRGPRGV